MFKAFWTDERGTETVEWGVTGGLLLVGLVVIMAAIGTWTEDRLGNLQVNLESNT